MGAAGGNELLFAIVVTKSVRVSQLPRGRAQRADFFMECIRFYISSGRFCMG